MKKKNKKNHKQNKIKTSFPKKRKKKINDLSISQANLLYKYTT